MNNIPQEIIDFNKKLNSFDYGVVIDNKPEVDNIDFTRYKTITLEEFEIYKMGVCWDFVNYETKWFIDRGYKISSIFILIDDNKNCPTHTFILLYLNNKIYWFESSWFIYQGIHEYETYEDAINDIVQKHKSFVKDEDSYTHVLEYDTEGLDNHLTAIEFMTRIFHQNGIDCMFP